MFRISSEIDSGNRSVNVRIGLEHINYIVGDLNNIANELPVDIFDKTTTLGKLIEEIKKYKDIGFGGDNRSVFEP